MNLDHLPAETEETLKKQFALALMRNPGDAYAAACTVFPGDVGLALQASVDWTFDPVVVEERARLVAYGDDVAYLPTKADLQRKVWDTLEKVADPEIKLKFMDLYAKLIGAIAKPDAGNVTNIVVGAMAYASHGSTDDWENEGVSQQALLQQRGLQAIEELEAREVVNTRH